MAVNERSISIIRNNGNHVAITARINTISGLRRIHSTGSKRRDHGAIIGAKIHAIMPTGATPGRIPPGISHRSAEIHPQIFIFRVGIPISIRTRRKKPANITRKAIKRKNILCIFIIILLTFYTTISATSPLRLSWDDGPSGPEHRRHSWPTEHLSRERWQWYRETWPKCQQHLQYSWHQSRHSARNE